VFVLGIGYVVEVLYHLFCEV